MLEELHVRDLALIEDVWAELGPRLTVLTGETGAGKTVLVEALTLLLGDRADTTLVRSGAAEAVVEGRFSEGGEELLVRRRVSSEGRSKCYIDGEIATVANLAERLGPLVDLHGQHDHQALLSPGNHARYLDRFVGDAALDAMGAYREALSRLASARAARDELAEAMRDRDRRIDLLRFQADEIAAVSPKPREDAELEQRLPRLRHGERLAEGASAAFAALRGDGAACDRLAEARAALASVSGLDPALDRLGERVEAVITEADEVGADVRDYGESVEYDPAALNDAEARIAALGTLKRKYGPGLDDVISAREAAERQLWALESGERELVDAEARLGEAEAGLRAAASELVEVRRAAAPGFTARLAEAASDLEMPKAVFEVSVVELPFDAWTGDGPHKLEFLFSASAGDPPRPLSRIASGGEVSRVMLALKSVLGAADDVPILVFDEVDAGIGGGTATAVGRRLAELAERHQVLVVTHLAQVAVFADRHLVVEKRERDERSVTEVRTVSGETRVAEIARMLSGTDTETGLAHARELIESVGAPA